MEDSLCKFGSKPICLSVTYALVGCPSRRLIEIGALLFWSTVTLDDCKYFDALAVTVRWSSKIKVFP